MRRKLKAGLQCCCSVIAGAGNVGLRLPHGAVVPVKLQHAACGILHQNKCKSTPNQPCICFTLRLTAPPCTICLQICKSLFPANTLIYHFQYEIKLEAWHTAVQLFVFQARLHRASLRHMARIMSYPCDEALLHDSLAWHPHNALQVHALLNILVEFL